MGDEAQRYKTSLDLSLDLRSSVIQWGRSNGRTFTVVHGVRGVYLNAPDPFRGILHAARENFSFTPGCLLITRRPCLQEIEGWPLL